MYKTRNGTFYSKKQTPKKQNNENRNARRDCEDERSGGIPLQLPKTEQSQLPADCGHPLRRSTHTSNKWVNLPNKTASLVSVNEGSA